MEWLERRESFFSGYIEEYQVVKRNRHRDVVNRGNVQVAAMEVPVTFAVDSEVIE